MRPQEVVDRDHVDPVEGAERPGREAQISKRHLKRGPRHRPGEVVVGGGVGGGTAVEAVEHLLPGVEHLFGVVESLGRRPLEGPREEGGEFRPNGRLKTLRLERDLAVELGRIAAVVAPRGAGPRGHLVERHRGGPVLGLAVVAAERPEREQRIEVGDGAGPEVFQRRAGEREIEEDEMEGVVAATHADGDVVGLDVAVEHSLGFEMVQPFEQVGAKPFEEVDLEPALAAEAVGEGLDQPLGTVGVDRLHQEAGEAFDLHGLGQPHDPFVGERRECLGLLADAIVVLRGEGELENQLVVAAMNEYPDRAGTAA